MAVPTFTVTFTHIAIIAKDVYEIRCAKPEGFSYKAGQFILFSVPLVSHPDDIQPRAYSIASAPHEDELLFLIKLKEGGRMSRWIEEKCRIGCTLPMQGPFGVFTLRGDLDRPLLFVATGTGLAPFRPFLLEMIRSNDTRKIDIVFSVRTEEDLFWIKEFTMFAEKLPTLTFHVSLTQGSDGWTGLRGRVQGLLPAIIQGLSERTLYVCGNPTMTQEVKRLALEQWHIPRERLHAEGFI